jgi:hypothetical protein
MQLVMTQAPILLATNESQEPYSIVLAKNVTQFKFQFWATNSGAPQWVDEWLLTNQFPSLIQYAIAFDSAAAAPSAGSVPRAPQFAAGIIAPPTVPVIEQYQMPGGRGAGGVRGGLNPPPPGGGPGVTIQPGAGGAGGIGIKQP